MTERPVVDGDTRDSLAARFADGDGDALRDAFDIHGPVMLGIARRLVGTDADEVVQQVFVSAWKTRDRFDPTRGTLGAWLGGITKFKAIDHLRSQSRRPVPADSATLDARRRSRAVAEDPVRHLADRLLLAQALEQLPDERRRIVIMSFMEGRTHGEIVEQTGLPLGTVKSHARRGLIALRDALRASGEVSS